MPTFRLLAVSAGALALALPTVASAGTVSGIGSNTYTGSDADGETVTLTIDGTKTAFAAAGIQFGPGGCTPNGADRVDCFTTASTVVNTLGADDRIDASGLSGTNLVADGGVGGDYI